MSIKQYLIYCEPCGYKTTSDGSDGEKFSRINRSEVPGGYPKVNLEEQNVKESKKFQQPVLVKCPHCGRGIRVKKLDATNYEKKNKFT